MIPARALEDHRLGIRRRAVRLLAMVEAGRISVPVPHRPEDVAGRGEVAENREEPSAAPVARVSGEAQGDTVTPLLPPAREPRSMVLDGDDLMPPIVAPWIDRKPYDPWVNSADFAGDDPEALRAAGPQTVATALAGLAEWGQAAGRKDVREIAMLIRTWLIEDAGRHDTLDRDLGLSPRDGRRPLSDVSKRAERDHLVILLSRQKPYADMGARRAAQALRAACEAYEKRRWPVDREERVSRPQGENGVWWQVMNLGLPYAMPGLEHLRAMIDADRATAK